MVRLIFILLLMLGLALAIGMVLNGAARLMSQVRTEEKEGELMPPMISKFAYIGLLLVMFGAAAGALGGF